MYEILAAIFFVAILIGVVIVTMKKLKNDTIISKESKNIIGKFVPDNSAPKLTDMIEYHKKCDKVHYKISE